MTQDHRDGDPDGGMKEGSSEREPRDDERTFRAHAGEAIADARNWPGYFLIALGLGTMGLGLTAAGGGFEGWVMILFPATLLLWAAGLAVILLERKRVKNAEGKDLTDPSGH